MHGTRFVSLGHTAVWQLMRIRGWLFLFGLAVVGAVLGVLAAVD